MQLHVHITVQQRVEELVGTLASCACIPAAWSDRIAVSAASIES